MIGGDGFCGWPTVLRLSRPGYDVTIADNLSRRAIADELGAQSLTPSASPQERIAAWHRVSGRSIGFTLLDVAQDYDGLVRLPEDLRPRTMIHSENSAPPPIP